jgi:hypothetical protein
MPQEPGGVPVFSMLWQQSRSTMQRVAFASVWASLCGANVAYSDIGPGFDMPLPRRRLEPRSRRCFAGPAVALDYPPGAHPGGLQRGRPQRHPGGRSCQTAPGCSTFPIAARRRLWPTYGGRLDLMFDNIASISLIRAGQLCALSVSLPTEALPGVPLISDFLTGYEAYVWNGVVACPAKIVQRLSADIQAVVANPDFQTQLKIWAILRCRIHPPISATDRGSLREVVEGDRLRRHQARVNGQPTCLVVLFSMSNSRESPVDS